MIFKHKDSLDSQRAALEAAILRATSPSEQKSFERNLAITKAGEQGEKNVAYFIDFELAQSPNWAVIHDLRLEWKGRVAQIDHILISRVLEIFVIESKSFRTKVRYANAGWERLNFNHWEGIASPVEQNARHIAVLKQLIVDCQLAPTRLGLRMAPTFRNVVAMQPSCSIVGKYPDDAHIIRVDSLVKKIRSEDPSSLDVLKLISRETLYAFATSLVDNHTAFHHSETDCASDPQAVRSSAAPLSSSLHCQSCAGPISTAEAQYCRNNPKRFCGKILCRKCQKFAPVDGPQFRAKRQMPVSTGSPAAARCARCGAEVDRKVIAFCRFNSKRLGGQILCLTCQESALPA